jgi:hypothetical protein
MTINRRGLITGLASLVVTAPAIVRASSLMPVKAITDGKVRWICNTRGFEVMGGALYWLGPDNLYALGNLADGPVAVSLTGINAPPS